MDNAGNRLKIPPGSGYQIKDDFQFKKVSDSNMPSEKSAQASSSRGKVRLDGGDTDDDDTSDRDVDDISEQLAPDESEEETYEGSDVSDDDEELPRGDVSNSIRSLAATVLEQARKHNRPRWEQVAKVLGEFADQYPQNASSPSAPADELPSDAPPRLSISATRGWLLKRREMLSEMHALKQAHELHPKSPESPTDSEVEMIGAVVNTLTEMDTVFRKNVTVPTAENKAKIGEILSKADQTLSKMKTVGDNKTYRESRMHFWAAVEDEIVNRVKELKAVDKEFSNYESPDAKRHRIDERLLQVEAAIKALKDLSAGGTAVGSGGAGNPAEAEAKKFISLLEKRRETWLELRQHPKLATVLAAPTNFARRLAEGQEDAFTTVMLDESQPEQAMMVKIIEHVLSKDPHTESLSASRLLLDARSTILNRERHWDVIECNVSVPLREDASVVAGSKERGIGLATVKSVTTPIGHVFGHSDLVSVHKSSAFRNADMLDYLSDDPSGQQRVNGVHSHSTVEHRHGVNVALTELKDGDKTLFSATRHATLSAYELFPDTLQKKPDAMLRQMHADLCRPVNFVTHLCTDKQRADQAVKAPDPEFKATEFDKLWNDETRELDTPEKFVQKARNDESFCKLLRRKAALNRAREVFLGEVLGKPELLDRVRKGLPIVFTSVSLITPDPMRHFLAKLFPSKFRKHDELSMRREELQAWNDLQESVKEGQLYIDTQKVNATVVSLCSGVNRIAQSNDFGPLGRWLLSGWRQTGRDNLEALHKLIGAPDGDKTGGALGQHLEESLRTRTELETRWRALQAESRDDENSADEAKRLRELVDLQAKIGEIDRHQAELQELRAQLTALWGSGEYRHAKTQPYKFAARLARMAYLIGGGVAFNCKSGKDRTAQLDLDAKLLSVQSAHRSEAPKTKRRADGNMSTRALVPGYDKRSRLKLRQMQAFVFQDKTRLTMQRYNTGVEGSKLDWWDPLYYSFIADDDELDVVRRQYQGLKHLVQS